VRISSGLEIILQSISNYEYEYCVLGLRPSALLMILLLIYQKKNYEYDYLSCIGGMVSLYEAMVTGHNSDSYHA
jgi:hypothetical protein